MDPPQPSGVGPGEHEQQGSQHEPGGQRQRLAAEAEAPQDAAGGREEIAEGGIHSWDREGRAYSVTQVSSLYPLRTFSAVFCASSRELKGPIRTRYMVCPAFSTGER